MSHSVNWPLEAILLVKIGRTEPKISDMCKPHIRNT